MMFLEVTVTLGFLAVFGVANFLLLTWMALSRLTKYDIPKLEDSFTLRSLARQVDRITDYTLANQALIHPIHEHLGIGEYDEPQKGENSMAGSAQDAQNAAIHKLNFERALDRAFEFEVGQMLQHKTEQLDHTNWEDRFNVPGRACLIVMERLVQQCPGGIQFLYHCRVGNNPSASSSVVTYWNCEKPIQFNEVELEPFVDYYAKAQEGDKE